MSRILIPRSDNLSAKAIEPTDTTKFFSAFLNDYITCSGIIVTGVACMRDLSISSGVMRVCGLHLNNSSADTSITSLTACTTHFVYARLCLDPCCEPDEWTFTSNTTGCAPANSMRIASVVVGACCVTSVCQSVPTNAERRSGVEDNSFFGDGKDGCVTIAPCGCLDLGMCGIKSYNNLTIGNGATITSCSPMILKVRQTLTFSNACSTISMNSKGGAAGCAGPTPLNAPAGGAGGGHIRLHANLIVAACMGIITAVGAQGVDNSTDQCPFPSPAASTGTDGGEGFADGTICCCPQTAGQFGSGNGAGGGGGGSAGAGGLGGPPSVPTAGTGGVALCPTFSASGKEFVYGTTFGGGGAGAHANPTPSRRNPSGGGGGGGFIYIYSASVLPTLTISACGGRGGNVCVPGGTPPSTATAGGGGGGGEINILSPDPTAPTNNVAGGAGGIATSPTTPTPGVAGGAGIVSESIF